MTLTDAINQLSQITRQGFADTNHLLATLLQVQAQMQAGGGGSQSAGGGQTGGGGGQSLGGFAGGLVRRFAPRFASHMQTASQVARLVGSLTGGAGGTAGAAGGGVGVGVGTAGASAGAAGAAGAGLGPVVLAVGVIVAVAVALAALPKVIEHFGQSLLDANKHLAQFSASMAGVFLRQQIRDIRRDLVIGGGTSASAQRLADALADVKDTNARLTMAWANLKNDIGAKLLSLSQPFLKGMEALVKWGEKLGLLDKPGPPDVFLQNELVDFARDAANRRAINDARFGRNPFE